MGMIMNTINAKFIYYKFDFFRINNICNEMRLVVIINITRDERKYMFLSIRKTTMVIHSEN